MKRRGFSVIEVAVVIAIIWVILSLLLIMAYAATQKQREIAAESPVTTTGKELAFKFIVDNQTIKVYHFKDKQEHEWYLFKPYTFNGKMVGHGIAVTHNPECKKCK